MNLYRPCARGTARYSFKRDEPRPAATNGPLGLFADAAPLEPMVHLREGVCICLLLAGSRSPGAWQPIGIIWLEPECFVSYKVECCGVIWIR